MRPRGDGYNELVAGLIVAGIAFLGMFLLGLVVGVLVS